MEPFQSRYSISKELDLEYLREVSGGDDEFEIEILQTFAESAPDLMEALATAIDACDAAAVRHSAHTLKGSSRSIGGQSFAKVCETIELAAKQHDLDICRANLSACRESYARLMSACEYHIANAIQQAA